MWENASPSSAFDLQYIPLDWNVYDEIEIHYITGIDNLVEYAGQEPICETATLKVSNGTGILHAYKCTGGNGYSEIIYYERTFYTFRELELEVVGHYLYYLQFNYCTQRIITGGGLETDDDSDEWCIPLQIYGIKGVQ